jgi:SAM-dependent methyltransferase
VLVAPTAALAAALVAGVAAAVAGASAGAALLVALAVALLAGLQVLTILHLRRLRRRVDQVARQLPAGAGQPAGGTASASTVKPEDVMRWRGRLPLPPDRLRFMLEDDDTFIGYGHSLVDLLRTHGFTTDSDLLDIGCGYGKLAVGLLAKGDYVGNYLGFDILPKHVGWCMATITPIDARLRFAHVDVRSGRYNPKGAVDPVDVVFPTADATFDYCALFSVFTHMDRRTVERYLHEIARVLRPGGVAVSSWLLFDDDRLAAVVSDRATYPLIHLNDDGSRSMEAEDPLRAIGFPIDDVVAMATKAGLEVATIERGGWPEGTAERSSGSGLQDLIILRRPA